MKYKQEAIDNVRARKWQENDPGPLKVRQLDNQVCHYDWLALSQ